MEYEYIIIQKSGVKIYSIPPMTSNKGHYLDSWKNKINEVNVKVVGKGHQCIIQLVNYDGTPFASSPVPENYELGVVRCEDSSRGYALKLIDPSGKSAWVGAVFAERNHSFDFIAALQDFAKNRDMELNPQKYAAENKPTQNFALKKGEKISFNVGGDDNQQNKPKPTGGSNNAFKLAPPPGGNSFNLPPPSGDFKSFQQQQQSKPSNNSQPFGGFNNNNNDLFGSSNTQQNQNSFGQFNFSGQQNSSQQNTQPSNANSSTTFDLL